MGLVAKNVEGHYSERLHAPQIAWSKWSEEIGTQPKPKPCTKKGRLNVLIKKTLLESAQRSRQVETPVKLEPKIGQRF